MEDKITGETIFVGYHNFQIDMNTLEILDSSWINGTQNVKYVACIGELRVVGQTFPEAVPQFVSFENEKFQKWKFGVVFIEPNKELVLLFSKRNPGGWGGEFFFPEDDCIYGISSSVFLTNDGNIDYESYVTQFPFFRESGNGPDIAENHRNTGAYFIKVE
ncbi:MAG: hypothetical protein ABIQ11_12450 [Saprospiraceae bacterium]